MVSFSRRMVLRYYQTEKLPWLTVVMEESKCLALMEIILTNSTSWTGLESAGKQVLQGS